MIVCPIKGSNELIKISFCLGNLYKICSPTRIESVTILNFFYLLQYKEGINRN